MNILYFDSWAQGAKYYKELDVELCRRGCKTKLMHIESLISNSLPEQAKQVLKYTKTCFEHNIECEDATWEGDDYLEKILLERPDAIVMLSISRIENRLVTRLCHRHAIPIYYMQHGSLLVDRNSIESDITRIARINRFEISKKIKKLSCILRVTKIYAAYFGVAETFDILIQVLKNPYKFVWDPKSHLSLIPNRAFAYTDGEKRALSDFFKIPENKIQTVGNPRLYGLAIYNPDNDLGKLKKTLKIDKNYAVYLDQAFLEIGWVSYEDQLEMISQVAKMLDSRDIVLVVKLHPRSNIELHDYDMKVKNCRIVKDELVLHDLLHYSSMVIGHSSTALTEAIAMNVPVVTLNNYRDARKTDLFNRALSTNLDEKFSSEIGNIKVSDEQLKLRSEIIGHMDFSPVGKIADRIILDIQNE